MNILFAASEAAPYAASGGLADVTGSLPKAIAGENHECAVVIPLYKQIPEEMRRGLTFIANITVDVSWRKQYCGIFSAEKDGILYYFIDNEYYFYRDGMYGFYDDCERFVFFARAVLEMLKHISFKPDVISCNDWQTSLIPVYYQLYYKYQQGYSSLKTTLTIHNIEYQGKYGKEVLGELMGIPPYNAGLLEYDGYINMLKGAIETTDMIITVSPTYANELLDPWYSHGLDRILVTKQHKLRGILNGIDTAKYNPNTDTNIFCNFSKDDLSGKAKCREELLAEMRLPLNNEPVIGIVTRMVKHKGIDLIRASAEEIIKSGVKFVVLGVGERMYEEFFIELSKRFPERVSVTTDYNSKLALKIYAGSDMFLMPSQSEPCGLAQMIAMKYGTIPIVHETGGLRDTVRDNGGTNGNGFTFQSYNAQDMADAVRRAKCCYEDKTHWNELVIRAMSCDFGWGQSALEYIKIFKDLY